MKKLSLPVIFQNLTFTINSDFLQEGQPVAIHLAPPATVVLRVSSIAYCLSRACRAGVG